MKSLVIYDSVFGNTEKIAQAIAEGLGSKMEIRLIHVSAITSDQLPGCDLLVVGSPTRGFRPTEAVAALLKGIPSKALNGMNVAAFDTRFKADEIESAGVRFIVKTGGYAARRIAAQLQKAGGSLAVPPEGFYVDDTEGPLKEGELERARGWGNGLVRE